MKKIKNIVLVLLALVVIALSGNNVKADKGGYYIDNYNFEGVVHENNTVDVKETIDVVFNESRHGIYRNIPKHFYIKKHDNNNKLKVFKYRIHIKDFEVNDKFTDDDEDGNYVYVIGDEDKTIIGKKKYIITYKLVIPDDRIKAEDMMFYSVLGPGWNTEIKDFKFNIKFDKPLSDAAIANHQIYSGYLGESGNALQVKPIVDKNSISGDASDIEPNNAITFYIPLEEGYFKDEYSYGGTIFWVFLVITAICFVILALYLIFRKDNVPIERVEFHPPEGFSSAMVGMAIDNTADNEDLYSLIPYWAQNGYITIEEEVKKTKRLILTMVKELPEDAPDFERKFFDALFYDDRKEVKLHKLPMEFARKFDDAKSKLKSCFYDNKLIVGMGKGVLVSIIMGLLYFLTLTTSSIVDIFEFFIPAIFISGITTSSSIIRLVGSTKKNNRKAKGWLGHIFLLIGLIALSYIILYYALDEPILSKTGMFVMHTLMVLMILAMGRMITYTEYGSEVIGRLLGLKNFIQTAEKSRLEVLNNENPEYYYEILPYAMVFGLSKHWANQFKELNVKRPGWYTIWPDSPLYMPTYYIGHEINTAISRCCTDAAQRYAAANSSSGSGGGFSGGGAGGGGGGSW